jgi:hypothetical protein
MNTKNSTRNAYYLLSALAGAAATFVLTLLVYGLCLHSYDLTSLNYGVHALSCLANGFFIATVLQWGRFRGAGKGAVVGALAAFLTDAYFIGVSVAMFGSTTLLHGLMEAGIFAAINALVGAIAAVVQKSMYVSGDLSCRQIFPRPFLSRQNGSMLFTGVVGGMTDLYFGFRDVAVQPVGGIKEMTIASALQDTCIWMVLNLILGALLALLLGHLQKSSPSAQQKS